LSETRKLAAILVADVVGYSRLAGADEDRTLARLRGLRSDLIDPATAAHHGRIVKHTGDGSIVEFRSVVDAVRCAIEVQTGMLERNAGLPHERRIEFRVGIHVGDVVEEVDGDLMGDGVNIAARLEGVAKPGGICLSEDAYRQVKSRLELQVADLGPQNLKNIGEPVRAYLLRQAMDAPKRPANAAMKTGRSIYALAALALVVVAGVGYAWHTAFTPRPFVSPFWDDKLAKAPRLSIVVLPFENLSGDSDQQYFAAGITDYLTTDLSHIPESFVIARNTALAYKGKPVDVKQIGRELGVRYALEGSVRRLGETVTVNAQLISTETGTHIWADRFEGQADNLGQLQSEVVTRLASSLDLELVQAESLRAMRERPDNPDAVDLTLRGEAILRSNFRRGAFDKSELGDAIKLFEHALALDSQHEWAMVLLAQALGVRADSNWSEDRALDIARAESLSAAAVAIRPDDSWAHETKGIIFSLKREWKSAFAESQTAIADDRNNADAYEFAGYCKMRLGRSEEGLADVEAAFRLSPHHFLAPAWQSDLCRLRAHLAHWEKAIGECEKAVVDRPWDKQAFSALAAAYAWVGRDKDARDAAVKARKLDPASSASTFAGLDESEDPTFKAEARRILEGLRKAGVPDDPGLAKSHVAKAGQLNDQHRFDEALSELTAATDIDSDLAEAHALRGVTYILAGRTKETIPEVETALRLSPDDPLRNRWEHYICHAHVHMAEWREAIEWCRKSIATDSSFWLPYIDLAAAYGWLGRNLEAKSAINGLLALKPGYSVQRWASEGFSDNPIFLREYQGIIEGLRKAGLPER
jgi:class 3 adenylate cyclase/TolB-like protein/Flp pilus assembly protein TadD